MENSRIELSGIQTPTKTYLYFNGNMKAIYENEDFNKRYVPSHILKEIMPLEVKHIEFELYPNNLKLYEAYRKGDVQDYVSDIRRIQIYQYIKDVNKIKE